MFSGAYTILSILFLTITTNGYRHRAPCKDSTAFRCDNSGCINKHLWCNNRYDCTDRSDEMYCKMNNHDKTSVNCNDDIHFKCRDNNMCIPREGVCDGYSSCPDMSDEKDCPCEILVEDVGKFEYQTFVGTYRTEQICWKIAVNSGQYLKLQVHASLYKRDCTQGNVTVSKEQGKYYDDIRKVYYNEDTDYNNSVSVLCPNEIQSLTAEYFDNVLIRYSSNYYDHRQITIEDLIKVEYTRVDKLCKDKDSFKCSEISCILPQKQCDGHKDCENGLDETDCDYGDRNRTKAIDWMKSQHNADWGWKDNTHRAVVTLYLSGAANYNGSSQEEELFAKQLELEVSAYLFRHKVEKMSSSELSSYIDALLVICHDPRNFYGSNLIAMLKEVLEISLEYTSPFPYLTLCNAKEHIPEYLVYTLLEILENSPENGFMLEIHSLAAMALSCIVSKENDYAYLQQNITVALNNLKKEQKEDGSFGNEYTTALVLQALKAGNQENGNDWSPKSALQFLSDRQRENGSFGDFLTTYLVLPLLNAKTLVDVGKANCTNTSRRPRDGNKVTDITNELEGKVMVKYSLYIGDDKDQIHPIILRTPENITVYELMSFVADIDPKYKFKTHEIKKKLYVYEISNIPNDPLNNKFWLIYKGVENGIYKGVENGTYKGVENGTIPFFEQSPDRIRIQDQDHIIMWYKTLHSV